MTKFHNLPKFFRLVLVPFVLLALLGVGVGQAQAYTIETSGTVTSGSSKAYMTYQHETNGKVSVNSWVADWNGDGTSSGPCQRLYHTTTWYYGQVVVEKKSGYGSGDDILDAYDEFPQIEGGTHQNRLRIALSCRNSNGTVTYGNKTMPDIYFW